MFNGMTFSKGQNSAAIYRQPITIDFTKDLQLVLIRRNFSGTPCIMMVPILPGMTNPIFILNILQVRSFQ